MLIYVACLEHCHIVENYVIRFMYYYLVNHSKHTNKGVIVLKSSQCNRVKLASGGGVQANTMRAALITVGYTSPPTPQVLAGRMGLLMGDG